MRNMKRKFSWFNLINSVFLLFVGAITIYPLWHELCLSFSRLELALRGGFFFWPRGFTAEAYKVILETGFIWQSYFNTAFITVVGTFLSLLVSCMLAYSLTKPDMPGCKLFSGITLFTMLFNGGMIPTYVVMMDLHLTNTLWSVILPLGINVYNLVLMRNFFEGIPTSLFESAKLDGCSPMGIFIKIVLPLSKAALAAIGLMFAVAYWNDYTNFKIYITDNKLFNFQMKLRAMVMDNDLPTDDGSLSTNTIQNAAIIVAIIPFMILYPFCQDYFVQGVNVGAVKE